MAILLDLETPDGLATYHDIGQQSFDDEARTCYCVLHSWADRNSRLLNQGPLIATRFDPPDYIEAPTDNLTSAKPAFYDFIATLDPWSGGASDAAVVYPPFPPPDTGQTDPTES